MTCLTGNKMLVASNRSVRRFNPSGSRSTVSKDEERVPHLCASLNRNPGK